VCSNRATATLISPSATRRSRISPAVEQPASWACGNAAASSASRAVATSSGGDPNANTSVEGPSSSLGSGADQPLDGSHASNRTSMPSSY
jgi:hypothetical protein